MNTHTLSAAIRFLMDPQLLSFGQDNNPDVTREQVIADLQTEADTRHAIATNHEAAVNAHTPGPWISDHNGHVYSQPHYKRADYTNKEGKTVEYMAGLVALPYGVTGKDHDANARLIAAAPEMLAALETILNTRCFRNDLSTEHHATLDQCRAAIAKAKDQPP